MKKLVTFLLVAICAPAVFAQEKGNVEFGVNGGYNRSTVADSDFYVDVDPGSGLNVGLSADYYFSNRWSIKGKLIYDQKGWNNAYYMPPTYDPNIGAYYTDINMNYLTIPLMANWHFGKKRNWYLNFGPYASFLMSAKETEGGDDLKEMFNTSDFGLAVGIGVKIPLNEKLKLFFEYEGTGGFSNILKNSTQDITSSRGSFNVGLNFMLK